MDFMFGDFGLPCTLRKHDPIVVVVVKTFLKMGHFILCCKIMDVLHVPNLFLEK